MAAAEQPQIQKWCETMRSECEKSRERKRNSLSVRLGQEDVYNGTTDQSPEFVDERDDVPMKANKSLIRSYIAFNDGMADLLNKGDLTLSNSLTDEEKIAIVDKIRGNYVTIERLCVRP